MRMKKTLAAASALAIAIALAPMPQVQAASLINPGAPQVDSLVQVVKAKKHMHMHKHAGRHMGRHARSKRPGSCGENMFWKGGHCMDARDKA
jgi:hypothetical protein